MQLNEKDLDKKLKQLKKKRKELLELAEKTDIHAEKDKYRKIKEDLKQNKIDITLLKEGQEKAERDKVAEQEKAERDKAEQEKVERDKAEQEKAEQEKAEQEKVEQEKVEQEKDAVIDYAKQIEDLQLQRKVLLKQAKKTDKTKEKEIYKKIKEDLKQNELLLKAAETKQEQYKKGEQGEKIEQGEKGKVLMQLQLGDIIRIHDPVNKKLNNSTFYINYIDDTKMKLIHLSSMTTTLFKINKD